MKQIASLTALLLLLLTGCTQTVPQESTIENEQETTPQQTTEAPTEAPTESLLAGGTIPVIALTTVDQREDVLDFVTQPVAQHVAQSIRSWTPD